MCTECFKPFQSFFECESHVESNHSSERRQFHCYDCKAVILNKSYLAKHCQIHLNSSTQFICDHCILALSNRASLSVHLMTHNKERVTCKDCKKQFQTFASLAKHTIRFHRNADSLICFDCGSSFKLREKFTQHIKRMHLVTKNLVCDICDRCTQWRTEMIKHISMQHLKVKVYKCAECSEEYTHYEKLRRHVHLSHNHYMRKEDVFNCYGCSSRYTSKQILIKSHDFSFKRKSAIGLRGACNKCFHNKSMLKLHFLLHDEQKKLECKHCGKRFHVLLAGNFKRHIKVHVRSKQNV